MSNIPELIKSVFDQVTTPGMMSATPGLLVISAFRKKLVEKNLSLLSVSDPRYLSPQQIDEIASAPPLEITCALGQEDIDYLADKLLQTYHCIQDSYAELGFHNPVAVAVQAMSRITLKF